MQYRIIATDLDKTLLDINQQVSPENWAAIEKLCEKDIQFVPASGRAYGEMPSELKDSPLFRYYITSDGTTIYDKKTGTNYEEAMSKSLSRRVLDTIYQYDVLVMLHTDTNSYVEAKTHTAEDYAAYHMNQYWVDFSLSMEIPKQDLKGFAYSLPEIQLVVPFFRNMEDLNACRKILEKDPELLISQTDPHNLEIYSAKAGKGNALMRLAEILGIEKQATIAVGDSTNDATMVEAAGLGLAVENAVPELKEVADAVICNHREHIAKYILDNYISA